ncbi:glycosyltransferase family 39 protein [Amphibiibacter pelophylacis]|uniref:Glycosyltransferase family 39 protein n=1 Tax=Amphibiibacter pelophylacis TaxID=1799477 RepID=A0ACC6P3F2_9BURK
MKIPRLRTGGSLSVAGFVFIWTLLWWAMRTLARPNLDGYGDMLENYAWGQVFEWGTHKHPPLQAWLAGAWFRVWPDTAWAYWLLAGLNVAVALAGVAALARQDAKAGRSRSLALVAVLLAALALPYSTLAGKLNANSVLLAVWPWLVWVLLRSVRAHGRPLLQAVALGLLAALAMLGKYYSAVLLTALALALLLSPSGRRWYLTRWPWLALAVCLLALSPHMAWLVHHEGLPLKYVEDQGDGRIGGVNLLKFALGPLMYWAIPLLGVLWAVRRQPRAALRRIWRGPDDILLTASVLVWAISMGFGLSGFVELSLPWIIPIGFAYTVLLVRALDDGQIDACAAALRRHGLKGAAALLGLAGVMTAVSAFKPSRAYDLPREAAAQAVMALWQQQHPGQKLAWVSGAWPEIALLAFYGDAQVRVLPERPDTPVSLTFSRQGQFAGQWGAWLCPGAGADAACSAQAQQLARRSGQPLQTLTVHASGWRWHWRQPKDVPYSVVFIPPN